MIKKIIHIAPYEKFIKSAHFTFETAFPNTNVFYIIQSEREYPYPLGFENYKILEDTEGGIQAILKDIETADFVVLHYLENVKAKIVSQLSAYSCKVIWIPWGADLYENTLFYNENLYGSKTKKLILKEYLYSKTRHWARTILLKNKNTDIKNCLKNIDIIGCAVPQEFDLLKNTGLFKKDLSMINFFYYPLELIVSKDLDIKKEVKISDKNILIGNSASPTSNHSESFDYLKKWHIIDKNIITPLNYGGDKPYTEGIVTYGKSIFKDHFKPILGFMPLVEYNQLISTCGFAIMNHYRQQAIGNIITLLWSGSKVFLNENNLVYPFLKSINCHIFSIQKDLSQEAFQLLIQTEIEHNRIVLKERFCSESVITTLKSQLERSRNEGYK